MTRGFTGLFAGTDSGDALSFLQQRVARFGMVAGGTSLLFLIYRVVYNLAVGYYAEFTDPTLYFHGLAVACFLLTWLLCRGRPRSRRFVEAAEIVGLLTGCLSYNAMGLFIPLVARPDLIMLLAMTIGLVARTIYVPSPASRTCFVGVAIGVPLTIATYFAYLKMTPDLLGIWTANKGPLAGYSNERFAANIVLNVVVWWTLTVLVCTGATRVIYGLRKQVRDIRRLGQYTLETKLGEGGMGEVYKARHAMLQRPTAIKLLRPDMAGERNILRFEKEVQLTSQLTHPNTIAIYDYGRTPEGVFYYAMELLEGVDLEGLVRRHGQQEPGRVIHILDQVCSSLAEAHSRGLIHRDVKPANVILCERGGNWDIAKVVDFGLVKDTEAGTSATLSGANVVTGTPLYMSPEALRTPDRVDARSDIYAVGAVGYFLVTGSPLFEGTSVVEICAHHLNTTPTRPSERLGGDVPEDLEEVLLSCLAKDPAARPQSARELRDRLLACGAAGTWNDRDAVDWWQAKHEVPARNAGPESVDETADIESSDMESSVTIDVDLERRA